MPSAVTPVNPWFMPTPAASGRAAPHGVALVESGGWAVKGLGLAYRE